MRPGFFFRVMLLISIVSLAEAAIIRVPQDYPKIQLAINSAQPGDTVLVSEGTYFENLMITKKILLASSYFSDRDTAHISRTIIDGGLPSHADSASVITIDGQTDTTLVIMGFTLTNGHGNKKYFPAGNTTWLVGTAIDLAGGGARISHNIIRSNNILNTTLNVGGTVSVWDAIDHSGVTFAIIEYNTISDNTLSSSVWSEGAALAIGHNTRIIGNKITRNAAGGIGWGGGLSIWHGSSYVADNIISENAASREAGGIYVYSATIGWVSAVPKVTMVNNIITKNSAINRGGGILQQGSLSKLYSINNTIADNSANSGGSGVCIMSNAHFRVLNTIIWSSQGSEILIYNGAGNVSASYSCIRNGWAGTNNTSAYPEFVASDPYYRLKPVSPLIGSGTMSLEVGNETLIARGADYAGLPRPNPAYSNPDIGAIEHPLGAPSLATTIRVPQDYGTIQAAINAAAEGNIVLVSDGIYYENLRINKKIILASEYLIDGDTSHILRTIIDGGQPLYPDTASVILIGTGTDTTTQITGFTIQNGKGTKCWDSEVSAYFILGNGIAITAGGAAITHNIIRNNSLTTAIPPGGGGICMWPYSGSISYYIIENNIIRDNILTLATNASYTFNVGVDGGGALLYGSGRFCYNTVTGNSAMYSGTSIRYYGNGGGAVFTGSSGAGSDNHVEIYGNKFINNSASKWAGAIYLRRDGINTRNMTADIVNNIFSENSAPALGAAIVFSSGFYKLVNNTIVRNSGSEALWLEAISNRGTTILRALNNIFWNPSCSFEYRASSGGLSISLYSAFNLARIQMAGFGNITSNPQLVAGDPNCTLGCLSPALGAGMMEWTLGGQIVKAPDRDIFGNVRPWPTNYANPDLGAAENSLTDLIEDGTIPTEFTLMQNYPNPFNPSTNIRYALPQTGGDGMMVKVTLKVYDILGREVATLVDAEQEPGIYTVKFEAGKLAGGIYMYQIRSGSGLVITKKMMFVK
ncbi:MAG: T9SS type A sorting domain-containing protein [Ignavibacteriaceae bacterium]|nr:T9SS type A sorting domain-containing protein [Ignavibacteriaceae bacterium]